MAYAPVSSETADTSSPVPWLVTVTVAPGMDAPESSTTVPAMVP